MAVHPDNPGPGAVSFKGNVADVLGAGRAVAGQQELASPAAGDVALPALDDERAVFIPGAQAPRLHHHVAGGGRAAEVQRGQGGTAQRQGAPRSQGLAHPVQGQRSTVERHVRHGPQRLFQGQVQRA